MQIAPKRLCCVLWGLVHFPNLCGPSQPQRTDSHPLRFVATRMSLPLALWVLLLVSANNARNLQLRLETAKRSFPSSRTTRQMSVEKKNFWTESKGTADTHIIVVRTSDVNETDQELSWCRSFVRA